MRNPVTGKKELKIISDAEEVAIGQEVSNQIVKEFGIYDDPKISEYVSEIGYRLVANCERQNIKYHFTLLDTPIVNAFAAPGGFIFVTKGLLLEVENEAELAGVVAHEIGHITGLHGVKALQKQFGYNALFALAQIVAKKDLSSLRQYSDFVASLFFLGWGRDNEFEADNSGIRYALATGYDPRGAITFFEKLKTSEKSKPSRLEIFFRSHPATQDRIDKIKLYLDTTKPDLSNVFVNSQKYKDITKNIKRTDDPKRGKIENSKYINEFFNCELTLPTRWKLDNAKKTSLARFSEPNGISEGELIYQQLEGQPTSQEYAINIEGKIDFRKLSGEGLFLSGKLAYKGEYIDNSTGLYNQIIYLARGRDGFILSFVCEQKNYETLKSDFESIVRNFVVK